MPADHETAGHGNHEGSHAFDQLPAGTQHIRNPKSRSITAAGYRLDQDHLGEKLRGETKFDPSNPHAPMDPKAYETARHLAEVRERAEKFEKGSDR